MKQDLTGYSDSELSLLVFNDEGLYRKRHRRGFVSLLDELFIYTTAQLEELLTDLEDDLQESA